MEDDRIDHGDLAKRYVALWNESDVAKRRDAVVDLWVRDGRHVAPSIEVRGHEELVARVTRSHERWVVGNGCRFRLRGDVAGHHDVIRFTWEMVDGTGLIESVGTEILTLDDRGKIVCVYQFLEV